MRTGNSTFVSHWSIFSLGLALLTFPLFAAEVMDRAEPNWWIKPHRMIQTNLREIDVAMDVEEYVASLKATGANVVLFNLGGIVANYPTELPFHYRNPFMKNDFAGEVVKRLHGEGIRVFARFDFSKVNESIAAAHPEWLTHVADDRPLPLYNGQAATCLNGWYQQEGMLKILGEAIDRYSIDGVFFNMISYPRKDYSGQEVGICQCENCHQRFRSMYGLELPKTEQENTPAAAKYPDFTQRTTREQFERVNAFVKGRNPNLAICTYTEAGVDIVRKESDKALDSWVYEEGFRTRWALLNFPDKQLANAAVSFPHYPHRHATVSPDLTRKRLYGCMINGAWLDFSCVGRFDEQEDRIGLDQVEDVFRFHAANERWLANTTELADVGLVVEGTGRNDEVRGLIEILSQAHVSYELVSLAKSDLTKLPALIVPVIENLSTEVIQKLDAYVQGGGRLLLTGGPVTPELRCLGLSAPGEKRPAQKGTYIRIRPEDQTRLKQPLLAKLDLVLLSGDLWTATMSPGGEALLRFIPPVRFGPPEKCYYTDVSEIPCLYARRSGRGEVAWIPWRVGTEFATFGHGGHAALLLGALDELLLVPRRVRVDCSHLVETNHRADRAGKFEWVSLYNHSGQLDKIIGAPLPIHNVTVRISPTSPVQRVRLLKSGLSLSVKPDTDGWITCVVPVLHSYEVILFEY
ncbi:MAG: hypothetical protein H8M99_06795 [Gloeobacteraceae cyanobacterium ES-bin-144]|nr:hypothetical protein [Verrucomicrobiales bacterium]